MHRFLIFLCIAVLLGGLPVSGPTSAEEPAAMRYAIDRNHSTVGFLAPVLGGGRVTGKFVDVKGAIIVHKPRDLTSATVSVTIEAASIDTGIDDRDVHLRTTDFFDTENHPTITFESEQIERDGENYRMIGTFTMRGVSKQLTLPVEIKSYDEAIGAHAKTTIDRTEYGVSWMRTMDDGSLFVAKEIEIEIYLLTRVGKPLDPETDYSQPALNEPDGGR